MKLEIPVFLDISLEDELTDPTGMDPLTPRMMESARVAVRNALRAAENMGFAHEMEIVAAISDVAVGEPKRI